MIRHVQARPTLHKTAHTLQVTLRTGMMQCSVSILHTNTYFKQNLISSVLLTEHLIDNMAAYQHCWPIITPLQHKTIKELIKGP
jgi:hypothetical protein